MKKNAEKNSYLYKAMFSGIVLRSIAATFFTVVGLLAVYVFGFYYVLTTQTFTGNQNMGEIILTLLLIYLLWYAIFVYLPFFLFLKTTYASSRYLAPLAKLYDRVLPGLDHSVEKKEKLKIGFYLFVAAAFLFVIAVFFFKKAPYMLVIGLVPFYVMVYKNWIKGLHLALGESFSIHYAQHRHKYMKRAAWLMLLMHIPIFWFFQPWVIQALAVLYFEEKTMKEKNV